MEQYLIYLGLQDVLTMKFESWKALVKIADQMEEKRTNPLYSRLGISFTESATPATIKAESEAKSLENPIVAAAELKEVKLLVKQVREVYSTLYHAISQEMRMQIGSERDGDGAYLWQWLDSRPQRTGIAAVHANVSSIFTMQQQDDETFEQ